MINRWFFRPFMPRQFRLGTTARRPFLYDLPAQAASRFQTTIIPPLNLFFFGSLHRELARDSEQITLVFDKANNSEEAFETLDQTDFHFIGSLVPNHHADLLDVPASRYQPLAGERLQEVRAYRTTRTVFGQERTNVVTHNDNLLQGQLQGLTRALEKAREKLRDLQTKLRRRREGSTQCGKAPTAASIRMQVQEALAGQHVKTVLQVEVQDGAIPLLTFQTDQTALARLIDKQLGKTILFTDNDD